MSNSRSTFPRHNFDPVPQKIENLYQGRIRQFTDPGSEFRDLNLAAVYDRTRTRSTDHVRLESYSVPDLARPSFKKAIEDAEWKSAQVGDFFGPSWSTHWFKVQIKVPSDWKQYKERIIFEFNSGDEGFVYSEDGTPVVGLSAEHNRKEYIIPEIWSDGNWHTFYVETSCNNIQGNNSPPDPNRYFKLETADLVVPHAGARALYIDFWIVGDAGRELPGSSWQKQRSINVLNRIINTFDRDNLDESIDACRKIAQEHLGTKVDSADVYTKAPNTGPTSAKSATVTAIGNCHIDTAWLWPFAETHRKIARSWASQLDLIERYPEYIFVASQAQQFEWLKKDHPKLFARVQEAARKHRFIPVGGSWVEFDTNMPTGEALARQFLLGQTFFYEHFGERSKTLWLPDTFGYSPQLPQLCRLAGMDRFLTQKLSWNNINVFPNTTFNWVGLDGSQVVCHMPPDETYTAEAHFGDVKRSLEQHKNLKEDQHAMLLFGHGDGGGGPTSEMIEKLRRLRGLADTIGDVPRVEQYTTPDQFFDHILEDTDQGKNLVSWVGELYLEYHRGTYTTQGAIKKGNRYSESLMFALETLATEASLVNSDYTYPHAEITSLWKDLCLNQFHDVLPGSSIAMVYVDARETYRRIQKDGLSLVDGALKALGLERAADGENGAFVGFDAPLLNYVRATPILSMKGNDVRIHELENERFKVRFENGVLTSVYDIAAKREVLVPGTKGNQLVVFEDQPLNFAAWDTEVYATEKRKELVADNVTVENNSVNASYKFGKSSVLVKTRLYADRIESVVEADWHETYQFLKTEFVVDVVSQNASYETSFGYQQRPTHYNTSWEAAKFEVCGHRYADLSDYSYGVAIVNDSKYGYSIHGKVMRLSLLRSPKSPDADADMGKHKFRYALVPHQGPLGPQVLNVAKAFNNPGIRVSSDVKPHVHSNLLEPLYVRPFTIEGADNLQISAVKRAEKDANGTNKTKHVVVRVYEALGGKAKGILKSEHPIRKALLVNLLEDELSELDVFDDSDHSAVEIEANPFEVVSVLLEFA